MVNLVRESFHDMLIVLGEAPCPRPAVLPPRALLPDVAGRLPAGAGPLPRGDGAALHHQICLILNSVFCLQNKVFILKSPVILWVEGGFGNISPHCMYVCTHVESECYCCSMSISPGLPRH